MGKYDSAIKIIDTMLDSIEAQTHQYELTKNLRNRDGSLMTTPTCAVFETLLTYKKDLKDKRAILDAEK